MSLEEKLKHNVDNKDDVLNIDNLELFEIPDLSTYDWVVELNIKKNNISSINKEKLPPNLEKLDISDNNIHTIFTTDLPKSVIFLDISDNLLVKFDGNEFVNLEILNISKNEICEIIAFPPNSVFIDVWFCKLETIPDFPESLLQIDCSDNNLVSFGKINSSLRKINFSRNKFAVMPELPDSVKQINCANCKIENIDKIPPQLKKLYAKKNYIKSLNCELPLTLVVLDLSSNDLIEMPTLTEGIVNVKLSNNKISVLKDIPSSVEYLNLSSNDLTEMPILKEGIINVELYDNKISELTDIPFSVKYLDVSENYIYNIPKHVIDRDSIKLNYTNNFVKCGNETWIGSFQLHDISLKPFDGVGRVAGQSNRAVEYAEQHARHLNSYTPNVVANYNRTEHDIDYYSRYNYLHNARNNYSIPLGGQHLKNNPNYIRLSKSRDV